MQSATFRWGRAASATAARALAAAKWRVGGPGVASVAIQLARAATKGQSWTAAAATAPAARRKEAAGLGARA
eukprot:14436677-Alexandrium_andersonii.AAC.1